MRVFPMRVLLAFGLVLALLAGPSASAHAASPKKGAERAVRKALSKERLGSTKVRCRRAGRTRFNCSWRGARRSQAATTCSGRHRVRRSGRRWRARRLSRRCATSPTPAGPAYHAPLPARAPSPRPATPKPRPAVKPPVPASPGAPKLFGFTDNSATNKAVNPVQSATLMRRAGANSHRVAFDWRWAEPSKDDYHFEIYDEIYREALARGVKPMFTIMFAPSWALESGVDCNQYRQDCTYPPGRAYDGEWRQIMHKLAERYPKAAGIEIWNEPNLTYFWKPRPDVARYTELLRQAYREVKAVAPALPVIAGGFNNRQYTRDGHVSLQDFVRGVYASGGRNSMDAIGVHPYSEGLDPAVMLRSLDQVRSVRNQFGDTAKPLWVTEVGLSTRGATKLSVTETQQAAGVVDAMRRLSAMSDVKAVYLYNLIEEQRWGADDYEAGFGLLRRDLQPKRAYCAVAAERGVSGACSH